MTWMLTVSGADVDLRHLGNCDLPIKDAAHALANINRFTGHSLRPYSVAEHSLTVVTIMEKHMGITDPSALLAGLLHVVHEALVGDLSQPMKQLIGPAWQAEEDRIQRTVLHKFGVWTAFCSYHKQIKNADLFALSCERAQLMQGGGLWPVSVSHPAIEWIDLAAGAEFAWHDWAQAFLDRYDALVSERADLARAYGIN